jgi:hypothetical protein
MMSQHPRALLARSIEEDLGIAQQQELERHVAECAACRDLERDLHATEELLNAPEPQLTLPAFAEATASRRRGIGRPLLAAAALGIFATLFAANVLSARGPSPAAASPSPAPTSPAASARLVTAHRAVLDTGPGGMPTVVTQTFDAFSILAPDGTSTNYPIAGVALGTPTFDGHGRVAYWARTSVTSGVFRLAVWDLATRQERTLLTLADDRPAGEPIWTGDGRALIAASKAGDRTRLLRLTADGTASAVIRDPAPDGLILVYADDAVIVGFHSGTYVVLDARSGQTIRQTPMRQPVASVMTANAGGVVWERVRPFESETGPLRVWPATDPTQTLATIEQRGVETPLFWPGRTEIVFVRGNSVYSLNYGTGAMRELLTFPDAPRLVAFDPTGTILVVKPGSGFAAFERAGDGFNERKDLRFASVSSDLYEPLGLAR